MDTSQPQNSGSGMRVDEESGTPTYTAKRLVGISIPEASGEELIYQPMLDSSRPHSSDTSGSQEPASAPANTIHRLSSRMGSLHMTERGHLKYFGATSNLHLLSTHHLPVYHPFRKSLPFDLSISLASTGMEVEVSEDLETHLLRCFFAWESPLIHIIQEGVFLAERAKCIFGAAFSENNTTTASSMLEYFTTRAKVLVEADLCLPTISTVQALVVLSSALAMFTMDSRGWVYSGMAVSLALELGLNLDISEFIARGQITTEEALVRHCVLCSVYVSDRFWGLYMGRSCALKHIDIPAQTYLAGFAPWMNYGNDGSHIVLQHPQQPWSQALVSLCDIAGYICEMYASIGGRFTHEPTDTAAIDTKLQAWRSGLNEQLQLDLGNTDHPHLPHVLQLHHSEQPPAFDGEFLPVFNRRNGDPRGSQTMLRSGERNRKAPSLPSPELFAATN
ncbi:hypothetical protein FE257_010447 [Aspergillus nanangensis]|uniref:Xylanolytic transcriptional activator regulatory domain-containing protein n=1 Tax=Aspergillus nanangensis TaxID=2582783 RepID=A0AAD4CK19_ASPNN|nr:hypothetical protein FE257_010447 [Aspergillus nanangensis]